MSISDNGQVLICDRPGCGARVRAPVALRRVLSTEYTQTVEGWLIVVGANETHHYCPDCTQRYLDEIISTETDKATK